MSDELRRAMLSTAHVDDDAPPDVKFLLSRLAAVGVLFTVAPRVYKALLQTLADEGPSAELEAEALSFAGDLGTVLQSLRSRPELLQGLEEADGLHQPPLLVLDELFHSFVLLSSTDDADGREGALTADELDELMQSRRVRAFMDWTEIEGLVEPE